MHLFARIQMRRAAGPFSLAPYPALVPFALLRTDRHARTLVRSSHGRLTRAHAKNVHAARRDTDSSTLRPKTFIVFPPPFFSPRSKLSSDRNAPINRPSIRVVSKFSASWQPCSYPRSDRSSITIRSLIARIVRPTVIYNLQRPIDRTSFTRSTIAKSIGTYATDVAATGFNIQGQIGGSKKPLDACNPTFFPASRACSLSAFFSTIRYFLRLFPQFLRRTPFHSSLMQRSRLLVRRNSQSRRSSFRRERNRRRRNLVESKAKQTRIELVRPWFDYANRI